MVEVVQTLSTREDRALEGHRTDSMGQRTFSRWWEISLSWAVSCSDSWRICRTCRWGIKSTHLCITELTLSEMNRFTTAWVCQELRPLGPALVPASMPFQNIKRGCRTECMGLLVSNSRTRPFRIANSMVVTWEPVSIMTMRGTTYWKLWCKIKSSRRRKRVRRALTCERLRKRRRVLLKQPRRESLK